MQNWDKILISPFTTVQETIRIIDESSAQIALVVDEKTRLLGTITDGDIRRGILSGISLDYPAKKIMNSNPIVAKQTEYKSLILNKMISSRLHQIPIVDNHFTVVGLEILDDLIQIQSRKENWVVLMAGGLGSRLRPLTNECPKPLLRVGAKPILETILESFIENGFRKFYLSVNYKAEMIEEYFADGSRWGVEIRYIYEDKRMGTAGALGKLPELPTHPIIVMNGDLLTKVNYSFLLDFHQENNSKATMCVREFDYQIPYGVVRIEKHRLIGIEEKPVQRSFVNAGIYVLDPSALELIPKDTFFDMPTLFELLIQEQKQTSVFPIREYWLDIGRVDDFNRANTEYKEVFG